MGLYRAGFDVTGVDINDQPRYPFSFRIANALNYPLEGFDFIWASPPCQAYSVASVIHRNRGKVYPDLVAPMRKRLLESETPYVIENVGRAPLATHVIALCGLMFGLKVFRHRMFECSFAALGMPHEPHGDRRIGEEYYSVAGGSGRWKSWGTVHRNVSKGRIADWQRAMDIDWMIRREIVEAIPPAYSEFIGRQALRALSFSA